VNLFHTPTNATARMPRRISRLVVVSIICGVVLTAGLTAAAFRVDSWGWGCAMLWQACLLQTVTFTMGNSIHEATPLFAFGLGVVLGVPIYSVLSYVVLRRWKSVSENE
jgi:hypothetical protein